MIALINKIGQRKFAKWIAIFSLILSAVGFGARFGLDSFTTVMPYFGVFLLSFPHWILYLIANKSKEFRLFAIFVSILILVLNSLLFILNISDFLFIVTIVENIMVFVFLVFVIFKHKKQKKDMVKKISKLSMQNVQILDKEE